MRIIAHRGYSGEAPENTLAAFDRAIRAGADALEFDLQETAEGAPVVFHDYRLGRTTDGEGRLNTTPLAELRRLDAGSWYNADFAGERVPTLEEALSYLAGRVAEIYVELKAGLSAGAVETTMSLLQRSGLAASTTVISFDWWALGLVREHSARQGIGFLVDTHDEFEGAVLRAAEVGGAIVDCNYEILLADPERVRFADELGIDLVVYTVDDPEIAATLAGIGVSGVTTNEVSRLAGIAAPEDYLNGGPPT